MAWRSVDIQEQRVRFVVAASRREKTFGILCQEFEVSRPTGYLWLRRYQEQGLAGIAERSRRPHVSPRRTGGEWEQQVVELRQRYPDWGARKLQVLLRQAGVSCPRAPFIAFCCGAGCCRSRIGMRRRGSASSGPSPTSSGRWISKAPRGGKRRWVRCRCSTITAAI